MRPLTQSRYILPSGGGGGGDSTVTPPSPTSQSVASGVNLSAKTFGSFTDPDSIIASYQAVTTNATGGASWSGSGLGAYTPSSSAGDSGTLSLNAKDSAGNIVATALHTYDRAAVSSGAAWEEKFSLNIKGATNIGAFSSGTNTVDATGGDIALTAKKTGSGQSGNVSIQNGVGAVIDAIGASGAMTGAFYVSPLLTGYGIDYLRFFSIALDVYVTAIDFDGNGSICNISLGDSTTWNDGDSRGLEVYMVDATDEQRRARGAGSTSVIDTRTQVTERVVTLVLTGGQAIVFADTAGTTRPANPTVATLYVAGADSLPRLGTPVYVSDLYVNVSAFGGAAITVTRIDARRLQ